MSPKFPRIFYGWWNVATGFVGMGFSYAMFTIFAFGVFVKPLADEFGWTRGELSFAITMTNFAVVLASPSLGFIIDRFGVRRVLIPSLTMMGVVVASMALLSASIWHFYALYFLIPFVGAGTLPQSYSRVLIAWFERRRGIALGISLSGFGVGAMLVPVVAQLMIDNYGWRMAYAGFGAAVLTLALPMVAFVLRESPAEMGLKPDGGPAQAAGAGNAARPGSPAPGGADGNGKTPPAAGLSCREAARTRSFWLILVSFMLVGIGITSVIAHLVPLLTDRGVAPADAALYMSSLALGLIAGRLLAGFLMDYFFAPYVAALLPAGPARRHRHPRERDCRRPGVRRRRAGRHGDRFGDQRDRLHLQPLFRAARVRANLRPDVFRIPTGIDGRVAADGSVPRPCRQLCRRIMGRGRAGRHRRGADGPAGPVPG